ncbi:Transposon Ty3-I Gag-Pol polyprotein [Vitis vinifera]|uniref:Transposon Ty3-I Gag-Pol polyprotein n=1 Tax=Vitis vinifera TaxID=29760 RepID=A0A438JB78_VITVI|nr:Transposon Ty3-I Gag-Pol polyprotein [Vitis vinifera]
MTTEETQSMQNILRRNHDIFAWAHSDMKGNSSLYCISQLNVFSTTKPVWQKIRCFHPDRQKVIRNEIDKLLEAEFIREVAYPDWLANVVVVPKKKGKWRVCVDYTNLNNACPKDGFPLPRIDQIVDSTAGQGMLSFLDAFSGYHQIPMSPADEEKTAFITPYGLYCYKVMSFGLKNAGATYQRLMTKIFKPLIGHTIEEVWHEAESFKCAFGVSVGKFLGFMVSQRGIEVSPGQVKAVMETPLPRNKKELQRLTGKLVALGSFIARFTDELRPFFLAIRKAGTHGWTDNCQNTFEKIKHCLMHPPILSSPIAKEKLYIYLAVSEWAISAVLFRCPSPKEQKPIYYVSRALADVETRNQMKKNGGLCELMELHDHQDSESGFYYNPQPGSTWSKPSGWDFLASNNEAEYEAIISGLDSPWLYPSPNSGSIAIHNLYCLPPYQEVILLPIHVQTDPSVVGISTCNIIEANQTNDHEWTDNIAEYLGQALYPEIPSRHTKIRVQAARFTLIGGHLYKRSFTGPYFRCLGHSKAQYVLVELHEGVCGNHLGGRSLAHRAHSQGYYWPTMKKDAAAYVKKCDKCQRYAHIPHMPSANIKINLRPMTLRAMGHRHSGTPPSCTSPKEFLLVVTDYFSKWVEAEAYANIKDKDVTKNFCSELNIRNSYSTPRYPQSNEQAKATNKTLITASKKRLEQAKGKWVEELPASYGPIEPHPDDHKKYSFRPRIRNGRSHSY